jgi:hypothetical protein
VPGMKGIARRSGESKNKEGESSISGKGIKKKKKKKRKKKGGSTQMGNLETNDFLAKEVTNK